jgi:hypothetical protein
MAVIDGLSAAAATYTGLSLQTSLKPCNSDHVSFLREGMPAVLTIGNRRCRHCDPFAARYARPINFDLALDILRRNMAFVADSVGRA